MYFVQGMRSAVPAFARVNAVDQMGYARQP
jgi:hypothetical protein